MVFGENVLLQQNRAMKGFFRSLMAQGTGPINKKLPTMCQHIQRFSGEGGTFILGNCMWVSAVITMLGQEDYMLQTDPYHEKRPAKRAKSLPVEKC